MAVSAILLDAAGWTQIETILQAGQANPHIVGNIVTHLRALAAQTVLLEDEYLDRDFTEAFAAYYARLFKRHSKLCKRLHFFRSDLTQIVGLASPTDIALQLQECATDYLGFVVLRPIHEAPLAQAVLQAPDTPANSEGHVLVRARYQAHVLGAEFAIDTLPMTQQDQRIGACAQAAIWTVARHFHARHKGPWISTVGITEAAMTGEWASVASTIPNGSEFLSLNGMVSALRAAGRKPLTYAATIGSNPPNWQGIRPTDVINRYIDSGIPVIVGLGNLGADIGHAVVASGQVFSHGMPAAALPVRPTRAAFCSAFYVNDDQQGPNRRMAVAVGNALGETPYNVHANVISLIIPLPDKVFVPAEKAEAFAWDFLQMYAAAWPQLRQDYANDLGHSVALGDGFTHQFQQNEVIARTYLTYGWKYKHRMLRNNLTDATKSLARATELPRYVWVTEFGTRISFSHADKFQRRIFAHCVVDATAKNMGDDSRLFFHAPGFAVSRAHDLVNPDGPYKQEMAAIADDREYYPKLRGNIDFAGY
ncbi:hypothetical protein FJW05_25300 [Mesorhizobium sp. B2-9-1]|uniref:hypothetical protein n=1 Tax=Mesorhizobium sp. B2-9-1 TaxID=2589898 RepID=UPI00112BAD24|nr:hypothetical protein [Mesorhizobium sp. B2-9-1]TPI39602.1 hypothetical protein FJW05_25300 [Mesorhizobium sp. B2-9-1]